MSAGIVSTTPAVVTLNTGSSDSGTVTSGLYNGQALAPAYIPSLAALGSSQPGTVPLSALAGGSAVAGQTPEFNGASWIATNGIALRNVVTKTANYTIGSTLGAANESNTKFVNTGATGTVTLTLPAPALGLQYVIANVVSGQTLIVVANNTGSQSVFAPGLTGGTRTTTVQFTAAMFTCYDGTNWLMHGIDGVWT